MTRDEFLHRIAHLRLNREPPVKPYKPILLAAVILLIHKGVIRSPIVLLDGALRSAFFQLFEPLSKDWPLKTRPKPYDPFRALASEGVWTLIPKSDRKEVLESDLQAGVWNVLASIQHAKLDPEVFYALASDPAFRIRCIDVMARAYRTHLPKHTAKIILGLFGPDRKTWELQSSLSERVIEEQLEQRWKQSTLYRERGVRLAEPETDHIQPRQISTPNNNIDLLGYQEVERTWWILELKFGDPSRNAVAQALGYARWIYEEFAHRSQQVQAAVLTDRTSPALLGAAKQGGVQVWTYSPEDVLAGRLEFTLAA